MKLAIGLVLGMTCAGVAACGAQNDDASGASDSVNLETATYAEALQVNEDGSDDENADPDRDEPLLLRGCGLGLVRRHLAGQFDVDEDGELSRGEREALRDHFGGNDLGPLGPRPGEATRPAGDPMRPDGVPPPDGGLRPAGERPALHPEGGRPNGEPPLIGDAGAPRREADGERREPPHARRGHHLARLRWLYDEDNDGALSSEERENIEADLQARCDARRAALIAEFDADGSGDLDEAEWTAAHQAIRARFEARRDGQLADFDADGDGELSREEHEQARNARHEEMEGRRAALAAEFDTDGDGTLSEDELAALREHLQEQLRTGERPRAESDEEG